MKEDRKEYLKNYRLTHKEQYRKYSKKYRENNITTYERLKQENEQLRLILGNQVRIKDDLLERINKAIDYISNKKAIINTDVIRIFDLFEIEEQGYTDELLKILKGGGADE